jgi:hypothetical protein
MSIIGWPTQSTSQAQVCTSEIVASEYRFVKFPDTAPLDPVDSIYSPSFLTQRDADELRALDQHQQPTARGRLLRTRQ